MACSVVVKVREVLAFALTKIDLGCLLMSKSFSFLLNSDNSLCAYSALGLDQYSSTQIKLFWQRDAI